MSCIGFAGRMGQDLEKGDFPLLSSPISVIFKIYLRRIYTIIAFHENLYAVIARSEATKQSQQGSQTTLRDCFADARNDLVYDFLRRLRQNCFM